MTEGRRIPADALVALRRRLDAMPPRHPDRVEALRALAELYGVSRATVYRELHRQLRPRPLRRADRGHPRKVPLAELERYCAVIAALKIRTTNKKGRHLSTRRALELMEEHGVETPDGLVKPSPGLLTVPTVNRYLRQWGYDYARITRPPAAVRFQARHSNELWQFDLSPSDLKEVETPSWIDPARSNPTLMLFSVVDDRSGVAYQEYRCVYGEDAESALRFLYNAMATKLEGDGPFQGIPEAIYLDNGPVARSLVFQRVMECLGVTVMQHLPAGKDGNRPTARSKGKVERPFRTVKETHETLYHFHKPRDEAEANLWLRRYLVRYNDQPHRSEPRSRIEDWLASLPESGFRQMCAWERFCAFAREPERRKVGIDARISVEGVAYAVDPGLAGEDVVVWWGLFDRDLYIEHDDRRYGPYSPVDGPIPLHHYRRHRKTKAEERADQVAALAERIQLPRAVLDGGTTVMVRMSSSPLPTVPFTDPDPFRELTYPNVIAAKRAVADELGIPLAKLGEEERAFIDAVVRETLERDLRQAGYFETEHHRQIAQEMRAAILTGQLIAVTGVVGSGKTVMLRRFQETLAREGKVIVSRSLSVEKSRTTLQTLITALFYDLSNEKEVKIPPQGEERERELQQLIRRKRKPIVLFVDEAHDLPVKTLVELKRLMEVAADVAGVLSIVLIGHPKLHNALRRSTMEEIGSRTAVLPFEGLAGQQADYIRWLLGTCAAEGTMVDSLITDAAITLVAERLLTPLQIEQHLILAFEEGFRVGERPVTVEVIENILARDLNDLEARLTRHGYTVRALAEQFSAKPAEIRQLFRGELNAARFQELSERMRSAGLPI